MKLANFKIAYYDIYDYVLNCAVEYFLCICGRKNGYSMWNFPQCIRCILWSPPPHPMNLILWSPPFEVPEIWWSPRKKGSGIWWSPHYNFRPPPPAVVNGMSLGPGLWPFIPCETPLSPVVMAGKWTNEQSSTLTLLQRVPATERTGSKYGAVRRHRTQHGLRLFLMFFVTSVLGV